MALRSHRPVVVCLALALSSAVLGCDDGGTTKPTDIDDDLGDGELGGEGPGGIGGVTAGMADPEIVKAEAMIVDGKYAEALELIDVAIAKNPEQARFHYVRGNVLSHQDDDAGAEAAYRESIALDANDPLPHAALGQLIAFRAGADAEAKEQAAKLFQTALKLDPKLASAHQSLGVVLISLEQYQAAIEALENAERLEPNVETAYLLAQAHGELGNFDKAVEHARSAVEYEPEASGADLRLLLARLLAKAGKVEEATREYEQVAKLVPDSPPLRLEVARGLLDLGQADAAMVHMQWLVETIPDEIPVIVNHGRVLVAQGKAKQAIARFDAALAIDAGSRAAMMYKIEAQVAAKRCKDAGKTFDQLAKALDWEGSKARAAKLDELPRALVKARGFLMPACK